MEKIDPCIMTIFGATGDLTNRKLLPALYFLENAGYLGKNFSIVCAARKTKTDYEYRKQAAESIKKYSRIKINQNILDHIIKRIYYQQVNFDIQGNYISLKKFIKQLSNKSKVCNNIFYLATTPDYFEVIVKNLNRVKLAKKDEKYSYNRVVFEKPFGKNLGSAKKLNRAIRKVFDEGQIYRIDHYLAKELVQNLLVMRFGNSIFEPLWNAKYIDHVQITVAETLGVENRGNYYDKNGSLRDVVQNHIMQLLCLTAMKPPKSLDADDVRDEKVKILKSIARLKNPLKESVKGQYAKGIINGRNVPSYREEKGVRLRSTTSSYFAIKFYISNENWKNVPFYVRTGKRLKERTTQIVIIYKQPLNKLFKKIGNLENNELIIRVQPDEGISFKFNAKIPGNKVLIDSVNMDFCHECKFGSNSAESYERLLHDVMNGDQTLFTRWDEVEHSWKIIDVIRDVWHGVEPAFYKPETWGPEEAEHFIQKDGRKWVVPEKPSYSNFLEK